MSICRSRKENDRAAQESPQDDELTYENKLEPSTPGHVLIDSRSPNLLTRSRQHAGRSTQASRAEPSWKRDNADSPADVELQK